jgi:N-glycosylase/DNA lyase
MNEVIAELINSLPSPETEVMQGVKWGRCDQLYTPAYWKVQYHLHEDSLCNEFYRMSEDLIEEICACILGGYGIKSEFAVLAFERLANLNLIVPGTTFEQLYIALSTPFLYDNHWVKYRFPKQKAKYIAAFLSRKDLDYIPEEDDYELRSWLLTVPGIGMKTASWITRNWLDSKKVAILDIHIYRAGLLAGFFRPTKDITKNYVSMEQSYLNFSSAIGVDAANLDALIWLQLKETNELALEIIKIKK